MSCLHLKMRAVCMLMAASLSRRCQDKINLILLSHGDIQHVGALAYAMKTFSTYSDVGRLCALAFSVACHDVSYRTFEGGAHFVHSAGSSYGVPVHG